MPGESVLFILDVPVVPWLCPYACLLAQQVVNHTPNAGPNVTDCVNYILQPVHTYVQTGTGQCSLYLIFRSIFNSFLFVV